MLVEVLRIVERGSELTFSVLTSCPQGTSSLRPQFGSIVGVASEWKVLDWGTIWVGLLRSVEQWYANLRF